MNANALRNLRILVIIAAAGIAAISYNGLKEFAEHAELSMAWLWPIVLDVAAAVVAYVAFEAHRLHRKCPALRTFALGLVAMSAALQMLPKGSDLFHYAATASHGLAALVLGGMIEVLIWAQSLATADAPAEVAEVLPAPPAPVDTAAAARRKAAARKAAATRARNAAARKAVEPSGWRVAQI